jgi:hypothetical protein
MDRVELIRELVQADERHSTALAELDDLLARAVAVRGHADEIAAVLGAAPGERERLAAVTQEAAADAAGRAAALTEARAELAAAERQGDRERLSAARRRELRARDAAAMAEKRLVAARDAEAEHERLVAAAGQDATRLAEHAAGLAAELRDRPRLADGVGREPDGDLAGVAAWASGARAALVVARSGVAAEREAVIRQVNELATSLLGEPQTAASAAVVAARVGL